MIGRAAAAAFAAVFLAGCPAINREAPEPDLGPANPVSLPTGQQVTPTLSPASIFATLNPGLASHPELEVGGAVTEALSPDGATLAVLTTGYNKWTDPATGKRDPQLVNEYVFLFDVSGGRAVQKQVLAVPNTWAGIAFSPDGNALYVAGGVDDTIHTFARNAGPWAEQGAPIALKHASGIGVDVKPVAAGLAVTRDGRFVVVANMYNDSISIVEAGRREVAAEIDLRPGKSGGAKGEPGGNYPYWVAIRGNDTAYVSSVRDREIVVVDLPSRRITTRIKLTGNPSKMILDARGARLFVAMDNADAVAVINTRTHRIAATVTTVAPPGTFTHARAYGGAAPNSLALSADERTLYVTNGGTNSIAVIDLATVMPRNVGLIPTGWYPQHVAVGPRDMLYVVNSKSIPGPNPGHCAANNCKTSIVKKQYNQYVLNLSRSGFQAMPAPTGRGVLAKLTRQVAANNTFAFQSGSDEEKVMAFLRGRIKHVIYIVRENRTYDQVLGDLGRGNGDPALAEFGEHVTPNQHALARMLVTLDSFYDPGEVSGNGWPWSVAGRESDFGVKMLPPNYAGRGGAYEWEGENRNVAMGVLGQERRQASPNMPDDDDFLPGVGNVAAPDGPGGEWQRGYLWSAALRAGKTVRNYGFFVSDVNPREREPFRHGKRQAVAADPQLVGRTDEYFRGYDNALPEPWRRRERLRHRPPDPSRSEEPVREGHAHLHGRGRLPGWSRSRRRASQHRLHRGTLREERRRGLDALLDREPAAHDGRRPRHRSREPAHGHTGTDDRRVRHRFARLGLRRDRAGPPARHAAAAAEIGEREDRQAAARRRVVGRCDRGPGLLEGGRRRRPDLQPDPVARPHGRRPAVSAAAQVIVIPA